jgi:ATP-dependent DNA ligase
MGFRCIVHILRGDCRLVSRNGNDFKSFPVLNDAIPAELGVRSAVLDGDIVALDHHGKTQFKRPAFQARGAPVLRFRPAVVQRRRPAAPASNRAQAAAPAWRLQESLQGRPNR